MMDQIKKAEIELMELKVQAFDMRRHLDTYNAQMLGLQKGIDNIMAQVIIKEKELQKLQATKISDKTEENR